MDDALTFESAAGWEAWLAAHHGEVDGVWLKVGRKGSPTKSITASEAGDVALCYGWIDSVRRSLDDDYFLQRYSRRRLDSSWSRINVERAEVLIAAGRMRAPGLAEVKAAKTDGRWDAAYESQRNAGVPDDLKAALEANIAAKAFFEQLGKTDQYLVILPLLKARTAKTRATRLEKAIEALAAGRRLHA